MLSRTLGKRYEIVELIGRGGMAYVYKARDLKLNRYVAVKVLREEYTESEQFIKKFDRESQAVACLSHPNIVGVYDVGVQDNIYYIVMEYIDGITLKQYLLRKGKIEYIEATRFVVDISNALRCAHENKIIHRDIKPHNILLTRDLVPKVADFGIARAITSSTVTMTNQTMGSVHYISPEQARGGFVDERSDLYSLGILYYELLTGKLPFDEENTVTIAIKHIQENIVPPKKVEPGIPEMVNRIVVKLTEKKPDDRYQNVDELVSDLDRVLESAGGAANDPHGNNHGRNDTHIMREGLFHTEDTGNHSIVDEEDEEDDGFDNQDDFKPKKKRKKPIITIFVAITLLALMLIGFGVFSGKTINVPDIKNMTVTQATQSLEKVDLNLEVEKEIYHSEVEAGVIISQNPESNQEIKTGKTVKVTVSRGTKTGEIPDVVGMSEAEAIKIIEGANFLVGEIKREYNKDQPADIVFDMNPTGATTANEGTKVTIYVSKGQDLSTVPNLIGSSESDARTLLSDAGLALGSVTYEPSQTFTEGLVIEQSAVANQLVNRNSSVDLLVSSGKLTTQKLSINLNDFIKLTPPESVKVKVILSLSDKTERIIYEGTNMSNDSFSINVEGFGRQVYEVFINGISEGAGYVDF